MRELTDERSSLAADAGYITTVCCAEGKQTGRIKEEVDMENVSTVIRRPVPIATAAASGLLAFAAGAVIALGVPAVAAGLSASHNSNATVSVAAPGTLGVCSSVGARPAGN
jgi:hypothetical protein